jgi:hypothetical protein
MIGPAEGYIVVVVIVFVIVGAVASDFLQKRPGRPFGG